MKIPKLTVREQRLLAYPPTEGTWICNQPHSGGPELNSQSSKVCNLCRKPRPKRAKLVWPEYVKACEKIGMEPGVIFWIDDEKVPRYRYPRQFWRLWPPDEIGGNDG